MKKKILEIKYAALPKEMQAAMPKPINCPEPEPLPESFTGKTLPKTKKKEVYYSTSDEMIKMK